MANDVMFEGKERRMPKIEKCLAEYGIASLEEARELCKSKGFDPYEIVKGVQPIAFENAGWAYTLGCAVAIKKGVKTAADAAEAIGIGLEAFCVPGSVAEQRNVGLGHGNLVLRLPGWPRVLRRRRGRYRHRKDRQPRPQGAPAHHPQRPGQGRRLHHLPHQRLHLCADRV